MSDSDLEKDVLDAAGYNVNDDDEADDDND